MLRGAKSRLGKFSLVVDRQAAGQRILLQLARRHVPNQHTVERPASQPLARRAEGQRRRVKIAGRRLHGDHLSPSDVKQAQLFPIRPGEELAIGTERRHTVIARLKCAQRLHVRKAPQDDLAGVVGGGQRAGVDELGPADVAGRVLGIVIGGPFQRLGKLASLRNPDLQPIFEEELVSPHENLLAIIGQRQGEHLAREAGRRNRLAALQIPEDRAADCLV